MQLAMGFFVSVKWVHDNQMLAPSTACFAQSWMTEVGDLASGFFVLAIGAHTFLAIVFGRTLGFSTFCAIVIGLWVVSVVMTAAPVFLHPADIFVVAGNWCSINPKYDILRLYFHYVWVILAEFLVIFLYGVTFLVFRHRTGGILPRFLSAKSFGTSRGTNITDRSNTIANSRDTKIKRRLSLAAIYMILYPALYILVTLPLASARLAALAGGKPSPIYLLVGGIFMSCGGWMNCVVYSFTRRAFLARAQPTNRTIYQGQCSISSGGPSKEGGTIELSATMKDPKDQRRETPSPTNSTDHIVRNVENMGVALSTNNIKAETRWEVSTEDVERGKDAGTLRHKTTVFSR